MKSNSLIPAVIFAFFGTLYGTAASAANETYFGVQYAMIEEDEFDLEPTAAVFRVGSMSDQGIGFEGRLGMGISSDDRDVTIPILGEVDVELEVDTVLGLYLVAEGAAGPASIYGIVGYTKVDYTIESDAADVDESDDESGLSYGFGANFGSSNKLRFNIEYMQYLDEDDVDASAISLGVLF